MGGLEHGRWSPWLTLMNHPARPPRERPLFCVSWVGRANSTDPERGGSAVAGVQRGRTEEGGGLWGEDRGMARSGGKVPNSPPKAETGYARWAAPCSVLGMRLKEASDTAAFALECSKATLTGSFYSQVPSALIDLSWLPEP